MRSEVKVLLDVEQVPRHWYNILADLGKPLPPPLDPREKAPVDPSRLERIFPKECVRQEVSTQRFVPIPEEIREVYMRLGRPTPLQRARRLEKFLGTPAKIYYKREDLSPTGSHKVNTAVAQAYYAREEGVERLTTETGAGQWGSALSLAGALFGIKITVYMTRSSYLQKPYRKVLMELYGAEVFPSPSDRTEVGRKYLAEDPNHPGSLGIAISEALEDCLTHENVKYSLGSVLNFVLLHQTVIGLEAKAQFEAIGEYPDVLIGCVGGGSNFAGFTYPFIADILSGKDDIDVIAVEPKAVPTMTRGVYMYDYGDTGKLTPLLKMFTLGHVYRPPPIHAGGLRYHGVAPTLSALVNEGVVRAVAYNQTEVFEAARIFAACEGYVPAPETAHAVKAAIDMALECKKTGEKKVIAFNFSGHGLLDLTAYDEYLSGKLLNYHPTEDDIKRYIESVRREIGNL